jgi:glycosyltransferase involved in cell wall biosynthesis
MTLVRAFDMLASRHENVRLLIVGDGPGATELRSELQVRGLLGVSVVTGAVDSAMVPALLTSMTVAVAPYSGSNAIFYFSPLKVFEYMAAGLPIVASRLGQLAGLLEDGVTALLCHPDDPQSLAEALERLYCDAPLRARLGRASRRQAEQHSWDAVCGRLLHIGGLRAGEGVVGALG